MEVAVFLAQQTRKGEGLHTLRRLLAYLVLVSLSKPPPRWRCSATATATRSVASAADSAWRARCSIRRLAAECRCVSGLLRLLVRTRRRVGVSRKEMCSDLQCDALYSTEYVPCPCYCASVFPFFRCQSLP